MMMMNCQNIHCLFSASKQNKTLQKPIQCSSCYNVYCNMCFQTSIHQCQNKTTLNNDQLESILCSRCQAKSSTYTCVNCNQQYFCQQCCRIVHSIKKFSFHSLTPIELIKSNISTCNLKENNQTIQRNHYHKKSPSYVQLQSLHLNQNYQQFNEINNWSESNINMQDMSTKLQLLLTLLGLKKSQVKLAELATKQKWQKISNSVESTFKTLLHKIEEKQSVFRFHIQQQLQLSMREINQLSQQLKKIELESVNVKYFMQKNKKAKCNSNNDINVMKFVNKKISLIEEKLQSTNSSNLLVDKKTQLAKQFIDVFKKLQQQTDSLNVQSSIKNHYEEEKPFIRNFDQSSLNYSIKDRKKPLAINTSTKYYKKSDTNTLTTKKSVNNISFSHQINSNYQHFNNIKSKKRKISIELYDMTTNNQPSKLSEVSEKSKQLQRIKSFDFLSSTVASFSSASQLNTQKKIIIPQKKSVEKSKINLSITIDNNENLDNTLNDTLKLDSKRYMSSQQLSLSFIRNKIDDSNFAVEQVQSANFLTTSSQLLPSIETLPAPGIQTTRVQTIRSKPTLQYGTMMNSPKSNLNSHTNKQRAYNNQNTNNSNKTFSGSALTNSIKSPSNKIITSAFKSPKVKLRYLNEKKQLSFNHLSQFNSINSSVNNLNNKQQKIINKNPSNRVLTNLNKQ